MAIFDDNAWVISASSGQACPSSSRISRRKKGFSLGNASSTTCSAVRYRSNSGVSGSPCILSREFAHAIAFRL
ncbi:Uncharacterised protein [Salmonella enterica subsp. enterica serovar Bovismorbificans]|uniref:Uncharacterized protein n=1 Tax=Salmonella enterica subsp. enterica serovar Bovismorbificans TaxID=58097 RepID=A0A655BL88_SALET|nr:Uncharacterised protein [Salmonella enterica subsp. enterica serovar Bovismorbificans]